MKSIGLFLFIALSAVNAIAELDLPNAPNGYEWVKILSDKSALLKPNGWFYREDPENYFYFFSQPVDPVSSSFMPQVSCLYSVSSRS